MAVLSRWTRGRLPSDVRASWSASVRPASASAVARPARILAWAPTPEGFCIGSPAALSRGAIDQWRHVGWHEIEQGGWDAATLRLTWSSYGGKSGAVELTEPGRLPELFRERVAASIVVEQFVLFRGSRGFTVSGRRDLAEPTAAIRWHTTLAQGLSWQTEGVEEATEAALARVRAEYDIG